ncbi:MAG: septal ring lytic transglycosylase RlpA family protein [Chloroflexota bacterium]|nr:septal ring lytic transglycosylase RlpA family protein [Chloroflexota bacterium]
MRALRFSLAATAASVVVVAAMANLASDYLQPTSRVSALAASALGVPPGEAPSAAVHKQPYMASAAPAGQFEELVAPRASETPSASLAALALDSEPAPEQPPPSLPLFESGIASTYGRGDGFDGLRTGCGQIFSTWVVQAAHKSLPCGTVIRVEDVETGRSVDAEVTDRGPYVRGRIVDLSWAAFRQLDDSGNGLLTVNLYIVETTNQDRDGSP